MIELLGQGENRDVDSFQSFGDRVGDAAPASSMLVASGVDRVVADHALTVVEEAGRHSAPHQAEPNHRDCSCHQKR